MAKKKDNYLDFYNHKTLVAKFKNTKKINIFKKYTNKIKGKYDTLLHLNVLEHIKNDKKELDNCLNLINSKGFIIILVPAHQQLCPCAELELVSNIYNSL